MDDEKIEEARGGEVKELFMVVAIGIASQYGNGVAESVIRVRQTHNVSRPLPLNLPRVDGYVAVRDCDRIGETWWLRPEGGEWELFLVMDCAGSRETRNWMDRNRILVEVDWETAVRWGTVGRGVKVERGHLGAGRVERERGMHHSQCEY